jgi:hypothetical protein
MNMMNQESTQALRNVNEPASEMVEMYEGAVPVRLTEMKDSYAPIPSDTEGTLKLIDDQ